MLIAFSLFLPRLLLATVVLRGGQSLSPPGHVRPPGPLQACALAERRPTPALRGAEQVGGAADRPVTPPKTL